MHEHSRDEELATAIRDFTPRLWPVVRAFATDADDAEDLLQDVWLTAALHAHERAAAAPLGAWLHLVALNRGRAHQRRVRRRRWLQRLWSADLPPTIETTASPPLAQHLRTHALWRAVAQLPALQREVLLLRIVSGYSTAESAQVLHRAEGTVKASLHRALVTLRRQLGDVALEASP